MVFSDASFLFLFLPVALAVCLALRRVAYPAALLAASLLFYYWGAGPAVLILLASIGINFAGGMVLSRRRESWILAAFIAGDLILLLYFKYADFFAANVDAAAGTGIAALLGRIALPIGVSFFTFQGISYLVDVHRGDVTAEPSLIVFGAYKAFFPQLIAGPIVRYRDVAADFHAPRTGLAPFAAGVARFAHGLIKKVLIADNVAGIVNAVFSLAPGEVNFIAVWIGALAYAVQIYFDFSGYSDMAIGLGQMFGIRMPENFNRPYSSRSITEFWRRWHISLSTWFRDYVYIPLGGNRRGSIATYSNLMIVFLLVGLWHGAAWTFVAWGAYNGLFLVFERVLFRGRLGLAEEDRGESLGRLLARIFYCAPVVLVGWVIFRAPDLPAAGVMLSAMFDPTAGHAFVLSDHLVAALAPPLALIALIVGSLTFLLPAGVSVGRVLSRSDLPPLAEVASFAYSTFALVVATVLVLPGGYSPFLYFRF